MGILIIAAFIVTWAFLWWVAITLSRLTEPKKKWHIGNKDEAKDENGHFRNPHADNDL